MNSKFIVVEGIDGSGKTSVCQTIKKILKKNGIKKIIIVHDPGGTVISEKIRKIIKNSYQNEYIHHKTILLLFYAARIQLIENIIKPALKNKTWIISDRHDLSSLTYQGGGFGIKKNIIMKLKKMMIGNFYPDLTIYLDILPKFGLQRIIKRGKLDTIEKNNLDFFNKVRNSYLNFISKDNKSIKINANLKFNIVKQEIQNKLEAWLKK
ncbi:Thymidylate kinase [Buchnera aphidicola (Symydobius americanus)]